MMASNSDLPCASNKQDASTEADLADDIGRLSLVDVIPDCAVCLQPSLHPVKLPCGHIFCFLCVKGVAFRSRRCALCRQNIPLEYFEQPTVVKAKVHSAEADSETKADTASSPLLFGWYYEGHNGWWKYDERATAVLEEAFADGKRTCELMIAGFIYQVDFEDMVQFRKNNLSRKRRIKRDKVDADMKGIAGLKLSRQLQPSPELLSKTTTAAKANEDVSSGEEGI